MVSQWFYFHSLGREIMVKNPWKKDLDRSDPKPAKWPQIVVQWQFDWVQNRNQKCVHSYKSINRGGRNLRRLIHQLKKNDFRELNVTSSHFVNRVPCPRGVSHMLAADWLFRDTPPSPHISIRVATCYTWRHTCYMLMMQYVHYCFQHHLHP